MCYSIVSPYPCILPFGAFPPTVAHGEYGLGSKVTTCQASHLTRRRWSALPPAFDHVGRCPISRDRLCLHHPLSFVVVECVSPSFGGLTRRLSAQPAYTMIFCRPHILPHGSKGDFFALFRSKSFSPLTGLRYIRPEL